VSLRFKRSYKPYTVHLLDFRYDRYMGTNIARNFSSEVRLLDPERGEDRTVTISMNEPLRYRGETFYQASFDEETENATVLQVVRNPGWTLPYIACILVSLGMLVHFGIHLVGFLGRRTMP
jgi:cytochrome c biogenesis protein ResB